MYNLLENPLTTMWISTEHKKASPRYGKLPTYPKVILHVIHGYTHRSSLPKGREKIIIHTISQNCG